MRPFLPSASMSPQAGLGGGIPTPSKHSAAAVTMPTPRIDPAPEEARQDAERGPDDAGHDDCGEADDHGDAGTEDQAREHVTTEMIGTEQMPLASARLPGRRTKPVAEDADLGVARGDDVGEHGGEGENDEDQRGQNRKVADAEGGEAPGEGGTGGSARARARAHWKRILGSITAYSMSTSKFTAMIMTPPSSTVA